MDWILVFTTSNPKVASHPTTPATPPAISIETHDASGIVCFLGNRALSDGRRILHVPSYC